MPDLVGLSIGRPHTEDRPGQLGFDNYDNISLRHHFGPA